MIQSESLTSFALQETSGLDAQMLQIRAADPKSSVWVGASAGTGKTKVLTDRVLRLLLPIDENQPGSPPDKILCLTFTKAGASEMMLRVSQTLSRWATVDKALLSNELKYLTGQPVTPKIISAARRLFTDVIDTPSGLKIMTIHSFCQSVLGSFPLESNIHPQFKVLEDDQANTLLEKAKKEVLRSISASRNNALSEALSVIAQSINEQDFFALLRNIKTERKQFHELRARHFDIEGLHSFICMQLKILPHETEETLIKNAIQNAAFDYAGLLHTADILKSSRKMTDQNNAALLLKFLKADTNTRFLNFYDYKKIFLTNDNTVRARLATQDSIKADPALLDILEKEAQRIFTLWDQVKTVKSMVLFRDLLKLCQAILLKYEALKRQSGALDFDDLIIKTLELLKGKTPNQNTASWVHYKLDQGLWHILIDEAQDTNPEQWQIIEALCDDFFNGDTAHEKLRTVFTVGDEKQSIYSFQRASPQDFFRMKSNFAQKIKNARQNWDEVPMNISFRSTQSVLKAVDCVFTSPEMRAGISAAEISHIAHRSGQAGHVELWPIFKTDTPERPSLWSISPELEVGEEGSEKLAKHIAKTIRKWLDTEEILASYNRRIQPGDIMILLQRRSKLMHHISKALKDYNIPLLGLDRMILSDQLIIKDLLALSDFILQPCDDLALACVLKTPFIGIDEDTLYSFAIDRAEKSLWQSVQGRADAQLIEYLKDLISLGTQNKPFAFFSIFLQRSCYANSEITAKRALLERLGVDALEALDEFLNIALNFENDTNASLQYFVQQQRNNETEIKREQDGQQNAVRIMTVHGSKGLQAPIVILPDTTANMNTAPNKADARLLWPNQSGLDFPLWSPRKNEEFELYKVAANKIQEHQNAEYRRLLYVAMTRAEDRLYIGGAKGKTKVSDYCWYNMIKEALIKNNDVQKTADDVLFLSNPQEALNDKKSKHSTSVLASEALPCWIHSNPRAENNKTLQHLRASPHLEESLSPLSVTQDFRFTRGILTHKLLQILPDLPQEIRRENAKIYLANHASTLSEQTLQDVLKETMNILEHKEYAALFGPGSLAEVPFSGKLSSGQYISGQIDRLLITPDTIYILDYKTNRPAPQNIKDVPDEYIKQMGFYAEILQNIYPEKRVLTALLWTQSPLLMPLDPSAL